MFGMASGLAAMSQAGGSVPEDALVLPMDESAVSVVYDPNGTAMFTDEGIRGTGDGLTLDLGEVDFGTGGYNTLWVEMSNILRPEEGDGFEFYLDKDLLEPDTDFTVSQVIPHLDSYESGKEPQSGLFFKNENVPLEQISVVDVRGDDSYGKITAAVAQGVLNQERAEVYLVYEDHHKTQFEDVYGKEGETWTLLRDDYPVSKYAGLATLAEKYKGRFRKMVLWDPEKEWTWCMAQMICAQQQGIPVTQEIRDFFQNELQWDIPCEDISGKWVTKLEAYQWAIDNLAEGCHKTLSFSAGLRSDYLSNPWKIYDYAAASRGFVFFLQNSVPEECSMIQKICEKMGYRPGSSTMGYGAEQDGDGLNKATNPYNVGFMVSDYYANGSFWCSFPNKAFQQRRGKAVEAKPGKIYVSFLWSDGDNVQWMMGGFDRWYDHPESAEVAMTYGLSVANTSMIGPAQLQALFAKQPENVGVFERCSYFFGDIYASLTKDRDGTVKQLAEYQAGYMNRHGVKILGLVSRNDAGTPESLAYLEEFVKANDSLEGVIVIQYSPYADGQGRVFWFKNSKGWDIPVVCSRYSVWNCGGRNNEFEGTPKYVAGKLLSNTDDNMKHSLICVHCWSKFYDRGTDCGDLEENVANQDAVSWDDPDIVFSAGAAKLTMNHLGPDFRAVTAQELMWRLRMEHNPEQTSRILESYN